MNKVPLLLGLFLVLLLSGCGWWWKEKVDITDTDFEYDVAVCDKYFELVECIIDKDTNVDYNQQMRLDLKNEIKKMQEEWKQLNEGELMNKCTEELSKYEKIEDNLNSFGCSAK